MKTDAQIQKDVMAEISWEPYIQPEQIGVSVKNGVVTLSGMVDSYPKRSIAEKAAKRVAGVKAVAEDIQVGISPASRKTDAEIAEAALKALKWNSAVQEEKIKLKVEDGVVTLNGEVEWAFQRTNAYDTVESLNGVRSVINHITIRPRVAATDIKSKISAAFHRNAGVDAAKISVDISPGNRVILSGTVRSYAEKEAAQAAAWAAAGIVSVDNRIIVDYMED